MLFQKGLQETHPHPSLLPATSAKKKSSIGFPVFAGGATVVLLVLASACIRDFRRLGGSGTADAEDSGAVLQGPTLWRMCEPHGSIRSQ
jgi:hypothetical protein